MKIEEMTSYRLVEKKKNRRFELYELSSGAQKERSQDSVAFQ